MERKDAKKSIKYKPPVIRQTLTSIYRIAKANPLLFVEGAQKVFSGTGSLDLKNAKLPASLRPHAKVLVEKKTDNNEHAVSKPKLVGQPKVKPEPAPKPTKTNRPAANKPKVTFAESPPPKTSTRRTTTRRSLSADHYERKKRASVKNDVVQSLVDLHRDNLPKIEERHVKFQTPERCSVFATPSPFMPKHSTPYVIRTTYQLADLHEQLRDWMKLHRKPADSYRYLKSFKSDDDDENKENVAVAISCSYEDLRIRSPITSFEEPEDLEEVMHGILCDLHKLILEGFSLEQSEMWLNVISQKYGFLEDEPQYWECRAALEQNRGNITSAVDCLRTAIVQGAEVNSIDRSLENLLHKFSLLNIHTPSATTNDVSTAKDRARIVSDARHAFKSSIIQFAIQQRNLNRKSEGLAEKKYVATPVRRSTRVTPSKYRLTPKAPVCFSLQELDDDIRKNMDFCNNRQLHIRFSSVKKHQD